MYSDRWGHGKIHPGQNFPDKKPRTKPPRTIERDFVQGVFVRVFVLLKIGGPRCVAYFRGSRHVLQSVTAGEEVKIYQK